MRVYKFGLLAPTENADLVDSEMRDGRRYYNTLVELENGRRAALRALAHNDDIALLEAEHAAADRWVESVVEMVKDERVRRRGRNVPASLGRGLAEAKQGRAVVAACLAYARRLVWLRIDPVERTRISEFALAVAKNARHFRGCAWGTGGLVELAVDAAAKATPFSDDLQFRRSSGKGVVGVQIQDHSGSGTGSVITKRKKASPLATPKRSPAFTTSDLADSANRNVHIALVPEELWTRPTRAVRCGRDPRQRTTLRVRVGSDAKRGPVWATFPMLMHRKLPNGIVKRVDVHRRLIGPRIEWYVTISVDEAPTAPTCGTGSVAVHLGWLSTRGGLRVGQWMDTAGNTGQIRVPVSTITRVDHAESIRSVRSKLFDDVRDRLHAWAADHHAPPWFADAIRHLAKWRSQGKLASLTLRWAKNRFAGDNDAFLGCESWRRRDLHLWSYESGERENALRHRKNEYRAIAATLARMYETVILDDSDYSSFTRQDAPAGVKVSGRQKRQDGSTAPVVEHDAVTEQRRLACPSELDDALRNAFRSRGGKVVEIPAANESIECPKCGSVDRAHRLTKREQGEPYFACSRGDFEGEIDTVALLNLLKRAGHGHGASGIIQRMEEVGRNAAE